MEISWNINERQVVESTNKLLANELTENPNTKEGYGIRANFQTLGSGQRENIWESELGKNLLLSFVFKSDHQFGCSRIFC